MTTTCASIDPLVTPYVDGALADGERRLVDEHVRRCAPCHSRVAAERAVHDAVRARAPQLCAERAPASLRTACSEIARLTPSRNREGSGIGARDDRPTRGANATAERSWRSRLVPYALAASLVLVVGGAFVYQATDVSVRLMAAELTADHVKCFGMNAVLGTHNTATTVEASMLSGFGWNVRLPEEPSRAGLELVGSRPCLYGEGKIAHIMYRHDGQPVSLFMLPESARPDEVVEVLGHQAAVWCVGRRTFVLVARESRKDVQRLASFVRAALQ